MCLNKRPQKSQKREGKRRTPPPSVYRRISESAFRINPNCSPDFPAGNKVTPPLAPPTVVTTPQTGSSLRTLPVPSTCRFQPTFFAQRAPSCQLKYHLHRKAFSDHPRCSLSHTPVALQCSSGHSDIILILHYLSFLGEEPCSGLITVSPEHTTLYTGDRNI